MTILTHWFRSHPFDASVTIIRVVRKTAAMNARQGITKAVLKSHKNDDGHTMSLLPASCRCDMESPVLSSVAADYRQINRLNPIVSSNENITIRWRSVMWECCSNLEATLGQFGTVETTPDNNRETCHLIYFNFLLYLVLGLLPPFPVFDFTQHEQL